jgi:hypothetical protein
VGGETEVKVEVLLLCGAADVALVDDDLEERENFFLRLPNIVDEFLLSM